MQFKTNKELLLRLDEDIVHLRRLLKIKTECLEVKPYGRRNSYFEKCIAEEIMEVNNVLCKVLDIKIKLLDKLINDKVTLNDEVDDDINIDDLSYIVYKLTAKIRG